MVSTFGQIFFHPPPWVFPVVWTFLYAILAIQSIWLLDPVYQMSKTVKTLFAVHLFLNWSWSPVFFLLQSAQIALALIVIIWGLAIFLAKEFFKKSFFLGEARKKDQSRLIIF